MLIHVQEIPLHERKECKNCWLKGNRNTFRLWFKTSGPHSSLLAAYASLFYQYKERAKYISPLTCNLFWCGSRRCRWGRIRVIRITHKALEILAVSYIPLVPDQLKKASIIVTLGSLEPLFLSRDLWQSFASSPAGAKWLQQDWDPSSLNSGPHLLPGQLSSHPFLIYRKQQNSLAGRMMYERGSIEHTAWKNNQFPKLVNWLNWKLCL